MKYIWMALLLISSSALNAQGKTYYVATNGNDSNNGTSQGKPFKTIAKALSVIKGGDLVYLRGGVYYPEKTMRIEQANGTANQRTRLFAYPGERVVIDGSRFTIFDPDLGDNDVFRHRAAFWHFKRLTIRNARASAVDMFGSESRGNILENLTVHDNAATGINLSSGAANNQVLNCDSYRNFDRVTKGQHADGFGAKFSIGTGNRFVGCRAWANADDGWDFWEAGNGVTVTNCWAFDNGYDIWGFGEAFEGNGNGFKLGRGSGAHLLTRCVAWGNRVRGFDSNGNSSATKIYNCTGWDNARDFDMRYGSGRYVLKNNVSFDRGAFVPDNKTASYNSWNLNVSVSPGEFVSLSSTIAEGARPENGRLPSSGFLKLKSKSSLIDQGTVNIGVLYNGQAPDLGAFETAGVSYAMGIGRMEAEKMRLSNYTIQNWGGGLSGGSMVQATVVRQPARASYQFTGPTAAYDISVRYRDETDGDSRYVLQVNGLQKAAWVADEVKVNPDLWKTHMVRNVRLPRYAEVSIVGYADQGEYARLDYVAVSRHNNARIENRVVDWLGSAEYAYPNPVTNGVLYINAQKNINQWALYTHHGQYITSYKQSAITPLAVDVSQLSKGLYFLKGKGPNRTQTQKIIIE